MSKTKNTCFHDDKIDIIVKYSEYDKINYCKECQGIYLKAKNEVLSKSISYFDKKENSEFINPLFLYKKMRSNDKSYSLKYENSYNDYRKDIINFITKLTNKYKVSEESFYLSILFLDFIITQIPNDYKEFDLLAIGSFFLAGMFLSIIIFN